MNNIFDSEKKTGNIIEKALLTIPKNLRFLSSKRLKGKLRVFLAGHIVAMVTYCTTQLTATCSPIIG